MSLFAARPIEKRSLGLLDMIAPQRSISYAGPSIDQNASMRVGTVFACVNLLAELCGTTIDYNAYRTTPDGIRLREPSDPAILSNPSPIANVDAVAWRRQVITSWMLRGNAWGLVTERDTAGRATKIDILNPDFVTYYRRGLLGPMSYRVLGEEMQLYQAGGDLWHAPYHIVPGYPVGLSPIEFGAQALGLSLAAEEFASRWFGDGATPSAVLTSDQVIDDVTAEGIKARFLDALRGKREPLVLGKGLSYESISVTAEESQFLSTIKATRTTVAQFFGLQVALDLVGGESGSSMTYSNVEQQNLNVLLYAASPIIRRLEELYTNLTPRPFYIRADLSPLLRVDARTQNEIDATDVRAGTRSPNEIRHGRNLAPVEGGDRVNWPPFANAFPNSSASGDGNDTHPLAPVSAPTPGTDPASF